ncbi:MAG: hypothetical protein MAGBODY4_01330 [Candidatus Marinimicrobia bacterium]|nr:hypothetical protein [Candidatus Neomarinimicrobiota bacterium]
MERQIRFAKLVLMAGIVCFLSAGMLLAQRSYKWEVVEETQIEPDTRNSRVKFSSPSESQAGRMRFTPKVGRQNISGQQELEKHVNDAELTPIPEVERGTIRR